MARNNTTGQKNKRAKVVNCSFCGIKLTDTGKVSGRTIDHFYPVSRETNLNKHWNKVIICKKCNLEKSNDMPDEYIYKLQKKIDNLTRIKNQLEHFKEQISPYYEVKDMI